MTTNLPEATAGFLEADVENPDAADQTIPFAEWVEQLTAPARAALLADPSPAAERTVVRSTEEKAEDALAVLPQILSLLVEVRDLIVTRQQTREYYTTEQVAQLLGRANWTVREWCRLGRVNAEKRRSGRGRSSEWVLPHAELLRIQKEGLLPLPKD